MVRRTRVLPYGVAIGASGVALVASGLFEPVLDPSNLPLLLGAIMLSAWYGGLGPGILATALGALGGIYFSLAPSEGLPGLGSGAQIRTSQPTAPSTTAWPKSSPGIERGPVKRTPWQ